MRGQESTQTASGGASRKTILDTVRYTDPRIRPQNKRPLEDTPSFRDASASHTMATQTTNPQRAGIHQREDRLQCTPMEEAPATSDEAASKNVTTSKPDAD